MSLSGAAIQTIKSELTDDPLSKDYSGMSDKEFSNSLNKIDRSINRNTLSPGKAQAAVILSEYNNLTQVQRDLWQAILSDSIDINNENIQTQISNIWADGITRNNLDNLKTIQVSRATELGIGKVKIGDVQQGRM